MKCTHDDCFTCPFEDCISNVEVEPERKKKGRKPLSAEEKAKRRKAYNQTYNKKHREQNHERYMRKTEGKVKRRYRHKELSNDTEKEQG
jgi:hypothetical protein